MALNRSTVASSTSAGMPSFSASPVAVSPEVIQSVRAFSVPPRPPAKPYLSSQVWSKTSQHGRLRYTPMVVSCSWKAAPNAL